ncbi:hypothetical protein H6G33_10260 [Calothrix sp. FACHB-1219]|uniref:hypothetical protein n=1 Tax=unclassified Calothrix TaxID=2619626 RepID=UPI001682863B|nr:MULTISPECIES: hypothetical protein [unclassified Calothrix]MBD2201730.1 hypothetical protein [Calothrix sp. FACHB-168]MBD2217416.1 hypothetical protein [Calothrix sp. FACHB-1219]
MDKSKHRHETIIKMADMFLNKYYLDKVGIYSSIWYLYENFVFPLEETLENSDDWENLEGSYYPFSIEDKKKRIINMANNPAYNNLTKQRLAELIREEYEYVNS